MKRKTTERQVFENCWLLRYSCRLVSEDSVIYPDSTNIQLVITRMINVRTRACAANTGRELDRPAHASSA